VKIVKDDLQAGIRFRLDGPVLTVSLLDSVPGRVRWVVKVGRNAGSGYFEE
jgi:hypothetical protein